jgi:CRP/FNR family transcriptional regulator, cyclic AMP receptor protein
VRTDAVVDQLRAVDLFRDFDDQTLALVAGAAQSRRYEEGQTLFLRGDQADAMFIVTAGKIRLSVTSVDGRDLTLRYAGKSEVFGEIALLDGGARTADAVAFQPSLLLVITRGRLDAIIAQNPAVAMAFVKALCTRLRDTTDQLESIALRSLEQRLAQLLANLARATGIKTRFVDLTLDISQSEIAMMVNASRPKVNQILVAWHGAGIATRTSGTLRLDCDRLQDIADSENG